MTTSTPPAWHWRDECAAPLATDPCPGCGGRHKPWVLCHEHRQMREEALSIHSHKLPDSDAFRERNDSNPDPTYQDCWPSERQLSDGDGVQSVRETPTKLPVGAPSEHPDRDVSQTVNAPDTGNIAWCCNDCGQDRYGSHVGVSTWHTDRCDICGETKYVTEPRDFCGHHSVTPTTDCYTAAALAGIDVGPNSIAANRHDDDPMYAVTADETTSPADSCFVESCPECGTVSDIDYGESVPCGQRVGEDGICGYWSGGNHGPNACTRCGFSPCECDGEAADIEYGQNIGQLTIPLWKQALWLARNIEDLHSPRPDVVSDDELRGMTLVRVLGIGADEHGDEVFRKSAEELHRDRTEEWSDGEFYDLVDRFGEELRCTPAGAT